MTVLPRIAALAALLCMAAGCGKPARKPLHPARITVLDAHSRPAAGVTVVLHPVAGDRDESRHKPSGVADAQGKVALGTYDQGDGAPEGNYAVTVEWRPPPKGPGDDPPDRLAGKFSNPQSSPFKVAVKKGDNELPAIKLP